MTAAPVVQPHTALVTGASKGIGAAIARELHAQGLTVVVHFNSDRSAAELIAAKLGDRVHLAGGDLSAAGGPQRVWDAAVAAVGRVDVLVNNAGAWLSSPVDDAEAWATGWQRNLALNLQAPADLSRLAIEHFAGRGGVIVNITSRSAHRGDDADHLAYGAAKGGLLALTRGIARGYAQQGVLAYAVSPAWVATELAAGEELEKLAATLPLGEVTPPEEVAAVVGFLASGRARHATGTTIDVTGADYVR
ncbi:SDR family oxidoreductase [Schumannella luteola]|uniref:NAD(P)-dependent dehydrogenase (Short-subunit alcohol dehydrogenase family) n=1 Tax=Schumannella luteola TaxID=472059 RepID=A0A852YBR9_9MICO|nr:SDR family oxidoreductase [Schumannella luteola]NYG98790.1 NAD(P)-dependent dehydrogenase (short-subunit alcohol dehydrogenase family) [Schumannella luteola]TPW91490.1 SDR family oxidoreductase [Schumannella luteola]